jgi:hypothetical protein
VFTHELAQYGETGETYGTTVLETSVTVTWYETQVVTVADYTDDQTKTE